MSTPVAGPALLCRDVLRRTKPSGQHPGWSVYSGTMSEPPDLDDLAQQYLDLWQDQVSAMARDPEVARALSNVVALYGLAPPGRAGNGPGDPDGDLPPTGWTGAWPAAMMAAMAAPLAAWPGMQSDQRGTHDDADGTPAAPSSSGDGTGDLDKLLGRLGALEERIAALESERAGSDGSERPSSPPSGGGAG